jgi:TonB family protein
MGDQVRHGTLLEIPLHEERRGSPFAWSVALHVCLVVVLVFGPYLLPQADPITIGSGPGGGLGGDSYSVGVADDLGGGAGMFKPSLVPQPPVMPAEKVAPPKPADTKAVPIPDTIEPRKPRPSAASAVSDPKAKPVDLQNVIPTAPQPGAGGLGGVSGGSGGGRGGGIGISIGSGTGGFGDSWYAAAVEKRLSSNWVRPLPGVRVEITFSFVIYPDGAIGEIRKDKSSGNDALDLAAERAIRASNPLAPPPPEYRGRPLQFVAQFVYPPTP